METGFLGEDGDLAVQGGDGVGIGIGGVGLARGSITKGSVAAVRNGDWRCHRDGRMDHAGVSSGSGGASASAATELAWGATWARVTVGAQIWGRCQGSGCIVAWARESTSGAGARLTTIEVAEVTGAGVAMDAVGMRWRRSEGASLDGACAATEVVGAKAWTYVTEITHAGSGRHITRTRKPRMVLVEIRTTFWWGLSGRKRDGVGATGATWGV